MHRPMQYSLAASISLALVSPFAVAQVLLPALGEFHGTGNVNATSYESDGALLVAGLFDRAGGVARRNLARYAADGQLDAAFAPDPEGPVFQVTVDALGRRYVSGRFNRIAGETRHGIARFTAGPAPVLDPSFVPQLPATSAGIESFVLRSDGSMYVAWCTADTCTISLLDANGAIVAGFAATTNGIVFPMLLSADESTLFISGFSSQVNGQPLPASRGGLAKLDATSGAFDESWAPFTTGSGRVRSMVRDGSTHLVVAGLLPGAPDGLARIDIAAGTADVGFGPDFGPQAAVTVTDVHRLPSGNLFVIGGFGSVDGAPRASHVAQLAPDGSAVPGWGDTAPGGGTTSGTSAVAPDGTVAIARIASPTFNQTTVLELAAADGVPQVALTGAEFSQRAIFTRLAAQPGTGRLFAGGPALREVDGRLSAGVVALQADLVPDAAWTSMLQTQVGIGGSLALAVGPSSLFLGGFGFAADGNRTRGLYRLNGVDGGASAWVPAASMSLGVSNDVPAALAVDEVGGYLYTANLNTNASNQSLPGRPFSRFALSDGLVDAAWTPTIIGNVSSSAMLFDQGFVYFGGFATATASDNSAVSALARFDVAGTGRADPTFKPFAAATAVRTLAADADFIYAGGVNLLVRINKATGLVDPAWAPLTGAFGTVTQLAPEASGGVLATGTMAGGCGATILSVLRIQPSGAIDPRWSVDTDLPVQAALGLSADRVLLGGGFRTIAGESRDGLAAVGPSATIFADSAGDPLCVH